MPLANRSSAPSPGQAGSAYIVTLLALVILTILVLTLTLVTQSEVAIGGTEKTTNRTLYAADSGLGFAPPKIVLGDTSTDTFILNRVVVGVPGPSQSNLADRVTANPPVCVGAVPANWSNAAKNKQKWWNTAYYASSKSERISWTGNVVPDTATPVQILSSKTIDEQLDVQPSPECDVRAFEKLSSTIVAPPPP
jgi:Tfp pilus assembly protein PilX